MPGAPLWGAVSVADHLRPNAFVAEIGLFDALVVPVPSPGELEAEWAGPWDGAGQRRLLSLIPDDRLRRVPWNAMLRERLSLPDLAEGAQEDVHDVQAARREAGQDASRPALKPDGEPDFDAQPFHLTRRVLQNFMDARADAALLDGMPQSKVAVIPAYDGPARWREDNPATQPAAAPGEPPLTGRFAAPMRPATSPDGEPAQAALLRAFGWEFLVPAEEGRDGRRRSHADLIKAALELSDLPQSRAHRDAFRAWTSAEALAGTAPAEARERMQALCADYAAAVAATKLPVRLRWGAGLVKIALAGAGEAGVPLTRLAGSLLDFGKGEAEARLRSAGDVPARLEPAALIHGLRESFAAVEPSLLPRAEPPLSLRRAWPAGRGELID